ncbi:Bug family tripartite tricarboxylate transporter substrate binding protein [Polaromonas sp.]|uniref:Bug family tripartite tricarboxylate transporter substrate binding protein n=1 Tax=Polaromonas sp. TaxID=1869339 RepID=UPI003CC16EC0
MPYPSRRSALRTVAATLAAATAWPAVQAQPAWPSKPIRLVVPFPPGGGTDLAARIIAERLSARLGQPVVIDNKPGASTAIGVVTVSSADPDGHTLLFSGSSSYTVNPAVRRKLGYDPYKQLSPLALVARAPLVLVTSASGPHKTLKDVTAKAAARPKSVTYTTFGTGSAPHLAGELLAHATGTQLSPIPYKGSAEASIGVARSDVDLGIDTMAAVNPLLQSGKLRVLAVISEKRSSLMPSVPAYGELQLSSALLDAWYAMAGPPAMAAAVRDKLLAALGAVMAEPEVRKKLMLQSMEPAMLGPQALREVMDSEISRYRALVARAGISLD